MKAVVCTKYGPPEVLQLREVEKPVPKKNEVLIKIYATAATASDSIIRRFKIPVKHWFPKGFIMELMMGLVVGFKKPKKPVLGLVFSGKIESVGRDIKRFKKGDRVYGFAGYGFGAYAEYKCMSEKDSTNGCLAIMPGIMSYEEAAAISYGGIIAMHYIKMGNVRYGKKVLIYGASGSVGTYAVQLAKHFGAQVTGVCSATNLEWVKSLGADQVIDYTQEDFTQSGETYDVIFDAVGKLSSSLAKKSLKKKGTYFNVNNSSEKLKTEDLITIKELIEARKLKSVIDRVYPFEQIVDAHRYVDKGHKKGNVVITL